MKPCAPWRASSARSRASFSALPPECPSMNGRIAKLGGEAFCGADFSLDHVPFLFCNANSGKGFHEAFFCANAPS